MPRQDLEVLRYGDENIVVGVSGFGSAELPAERWTPLADLTGRTAYVLAYEAQALSMPSVSIAFAVELQHKWTKAREAAKSTSEYLAHWVRRWSNENREVLLVGFSLGAYVVWEALREATKDGPLQNVDVILLQGAIADKPEVWEPIKRIRRLVNVYAGEDLVLKYVYPRGVTSGETPAAGLGPLSVRYPNLFEIDIGPFAGRDHGWGSRNLDRLIRLSLGCLWSRDGSACKIREIDTFRSGGVVTSDEYLRLLRWTRIDKGLSGLIGRALGGDIEATEKVKRLDQWSREDRMPDLIVAGLVHKPSKTLSGLLAAQIP